jgi:ribonuclease-3
LQEYTQRRSGIRPEYRIVAASGPDHEKSFRVEVWVAGEQLGVGEGSSRREAETAAAAVAIETIRAARETRDPAIRSRSRAAASA